MIRPRRPGIGLLSIMLLWCVGAASVRAAESSEAILSANLREHAGLSLVWESTLPVKKGERLNVMELHGNRLYVRSSRNYVWSLDRANGDVVFSRSVARPGIPVVGWQVYGNRIVSVVGGQLVELDTDTGIEQRVSDLELSIVGAPVRNELFFYVSAGDRRLHVLRAKDMVQMFEVSARNESLITSVLGDDEMAVFGTNEGNLIAIMADAPRKLWQFDAAGPITGSVVRDGRSFYFASKDTNVYRVDTQGTPLASLAWKFQTEAVLDRGPRLTRDVVYQYALGRGLTAIDKATGQPLWYLRQGLDLLAEVAGKAYVITTRKTLAVMDNATGKRLYRVNIAGVVNHVANSMDSQIYIADENGRLACLRPGQ